MTLAMLARTARPDLGKLEPLREAGPACRAYADFLRQSDASFSAIDAAIATRSYRMARETLGFLQACVAAGASPALWRAGEFVVAPLTNGEQLAFASIVLDPGLPPETEPRVLQIEISEDDAAQTENRYFGVDPRVRGGPPRPPYAAMLLEVQRAHRLAVVLAPLVLREQYVSRPTPPYEIDDGVSASFVSMGLLAQSAAYGWGVTTALHGIDQNKPYQIRDQGGSLHAVQGMVVNPVLDSAFLRLSSPPSCNMPAGQLKARPFPPDPLMSHSFHGAVSGQTAAKVTGWVDDLLTIAPWLQNRVFTDPILKSGDSGSALIDANDQVIGFAFYNDNFATTARSAWIWADSVRDDLEL